MDQKIIPGYYAVIPATVRYDKSVCPNAKLLYGEITALCSKEGYCWATNQYFSDLYGVKPRAISDWVGQLRGSGYIRIEITDRVMRKIFLVEVGENSPGGVRKFTRGVGEKAPHSITVNSEEKPEPLSGTPDASFEDFWKAYPKKELKKKTVEIWKRRKLGEFLPEILAFIEKAKKTDRWKRGMIKQPPVFLNGDCWNDDLAGYNDVPKDTGPGFVKSTAISSDAVRFLEKKRKEEEEAREKAEAGKTNDNLRRLNSQIKTMAESKRVT